MKWTILGATAASLLMPMTANAAATVVIARTAPVVVTGAGSVEKIHDRRGNDHRDDRYEHRDDRRDDRRDGDYDDRDRRDGDYDRRDRRDDRYDERKRASEHDRRIHATRILINKGYRNVRYVGKSGGSFVFLATEIRGRVVKFWIDEYSMQTVRYRIVRG